jgi:hypothetical protein
LHGSCSGKQEGFSQVCKSEIALLRQQITVEWAAMRQGLQGISLGSARHAFIHTRMERVAACQDSLADQLGENAACEIVCHLYVEAMEPEALQDAVL